MHSCCRSIATEAAKKEVQRTVLGVVQPGDTIPVPYGWQRAGTAENICILPRLHLACREMQGAHGRE